MSTVDESEIMKRLQNDDQSALTVVLRDVVPALWPLLIRKFRESLSNEDIEEIVATSLTKVWQNRNKFDITKGDFNGWFYVILRNSALDLLRNRTPKVEEFLTVEPISNTTNTPIEEMQYVLRNIIATLSEREQKVILPLFDRSGVSVADLSESLAASTGAIRQLRFRAMNKLNNGLAEFGFTTRRVRADLPRQAGTKE